MRRAASPNYTPEEVWEADGGILTLGEDELRGLVSVALSKVPKRVANKVFKGCIFVMAKFEWGAGTYIPKELLEGKCVIALSERLMDEDRKSAVRLAESIRKKIEAQSITVRRQMHNVTVSIGVSTYPKDGIQEEELVKVADERLYRAKSDGRNKTCAE